MKFKGGLYHQTQIKLAYKKFHYQFESIHPFQDGNGRVGRIIMFKECLKNDILPFITDHELKFFYYRGLKEYKTEKGYLTDTCLSVQDQYEKMVASAIAAS